MPEKKTLERARRDKRQGKAATTQAGEFVREEMEHVKEGKHGVRSRKQAVAIGLSKARRAGVKIPRKGASAARGGAKRGPSRRGTAKTTGRAAPKRGATAGSRTRKPASRAGGRKPAAARRRR